MSNLNDPHKHTTIVSLVVLTHLSELRINIYTNIERYDTKRDIKYVELSIN